MMLQPLAHDANLTMKGNVMKVYVIVIGVDVYQYGPFVSYDSANKWLESNRNAFYGKKTFVQTLEPIKV